MSARIAPSQNFRNPVGLLFRMLLSGRRAAYSALFHEGLRILSRPLDCMLRGRERRLTAAGPPGDFPLILVVGAPRSGTTLVYQTLARYLDVSCFSNLTSLFPQSPTCATRLFGRRTVSRSADFQNYYGQTAGLDGPNDGFCVWNRWLGSDRYVPRTDLSAAEQADMRSFFERWCLVFQKPFLNKNNRNTSCLDLLSRALPHSVFVVVRRNPIRVARSLIHARRTVQGDPSVGWGLHAQESSTAEDRLAYVDDVCQQVLHIEDELDQQLHHIASERIIEITYEGFCEAPHAVLRQIAGAIPQVRLNQQLIDRELHPFDISEGHEISDPEQQRMLMRFQQFSQDRTQQGNLCQRVAIEHQNGNYEAPAGSRET